MLLLTLKTVRNDGFFVLNICFEEKDVIMKEVIFVKIKKYV